MDYCLHNYFNYNVDKYNFRQVVLYALRNHVCCLHLRDTSTSRLSLYDVNDWLVDIKRDEEDLAIAKKNLKLAIEEKEALTEDIIKAAYQKEVERVTSLRECKNSYHIDILNDINKCVSKYRTDLNILFEQNPVTENYGLLEIEDLLEEIYDTAAKDATHHAQSNLDAVAEMHKTPLISYEEFCIKYKNHLLDCIELYQGQVDRYKRIIKNSQESNAMIQDVFNALDKWEKAKAAEV